MHLLQLTQLRYVIKTFCLDFWKLIELFQTCQTTGSDISSQIAATTGGVKIFNFRKVPVKPINQSSVTEFAGDYKDYSSLNQNPEFHVIQPSEIFIAMWKGIRMVFQKRQVIIIKDDPQNAVCYVSEVFTL